MAETTPIRVGIAEYGLSTDGRPLVTNGVGSCGVIVLHDDVAEVSGMLHFMLPARESPSPDDPDEKFADSGLEALLSAFESHGGRRRRAWAKLAGGARMFEFDSFDAPIGEQNVEAARTGLEERSVPIRGSDVGGSEGRQVTLRPDSGEMIVNTAAGETRRL
ncbi:chemotaxis protein CheD [Halobiforma nitratireducens]|uniref:Probable chemoreceptor glutamine deamidase CheD n=1 Tax=Halobiforma nitratireducens JCM 10879 TaxID=1227454 RepID=M0M0R6_9EURY|nr:chemotaxis protein CheD [Halobiforma nitratireducens]EMA38219.1 chemotaxis protein CheD [Halobiforma nitratireducens JCM 10879]